MKINRIIVWILRIVFGGTYIFSGFVKAVDPLGTYYKINDYLIAWNMDFLGSLSLVASIGLSTLEFIIGFAILFGVGMRFFATLALILQSLFTIQTLYIAIYNPVSDCGCFGDALILSNWDTFYKNVVLIAIAFLIFKARKYTLPAFKRNSWAPVILSFVLILFVSVYSLMYLPIIDFRPYKVGNDIYEKTIIPEDEMPVTETFYEVKVKETGEIVEVPNDEYMNNYEKYDMISYRDIVVKEGRTEPEIHDFKFNTLEGGDLTEEFFSQKGYKLLIVQLDLEKTSSDDQKDINDLVNSIQKNNKVKVWAITNSVDKIESYTKENNVPYTYCWMDQIPIKTIIRSSPGLVLLKGNVVIKKWPHRKLPDYEDLMDYLK
jgi:uncharacterized membrane protein YphA (DoxX/SURF4 family)